jgi:diadenosine tetraphosphatase ApaH/serine/threonine PP2A family protein phosphatase
VVQALVVCGHTHHRFDLRAGGRRVVNAGSIGMPYEADAAAFWLLVHAGEPEHRRTEYDVDAAVAAIRATGHPDAEDVVRWSLLEPVAAAEAARIFEPRPPDG